MSGKLMGQVFEYEVPSSEQLVLLALADHGDDNGNNIRPGIRRIAWKVGKSERHVKRIMERLRGRGVLPVDEQGGGRRQGSNDKGKPTVYRLNLDALPRKKPLGYGDTSATVKPPSNGVTGDTVNPSDTVTSGAGYGDISSPDTVTFSASYGDIAVSPEPSLNQSSVKPSINPSIEDDGLPPDLKYLLDSLCSTSGTWQHSRKDVEELAAKEDPGPVTEALRRCREMEDAGNPIDKPVAYLRRILKNLTTGEDSSVLRPFVRDRVQPGRRSLEMARKLADADGGSESFKALFGLPNVHDEQVLEGEVEEEVQT